MRAPIPYLSDEWHALVMKEVHGLRFDSDGEGHIIGYDIELPDGSSTTYFQKFIGGELAEQAFGDISAASVILKLSYRFNYEWICGNVDARKAFFDGQIRYLGDLTALVDVSAFAECEGYNDARLRVLSQTEFSDFDSVRRATGFVP
jgi:hypothetical protein